MRIDKNGFSFIVSDERIKSFKKKDEFLKKQKEDFKTTKLDPNLVEEVSGEMWEAINNRPKETKE